jgi:lysophospholipase L1-like esterase
MTRAADPAVAHPPTLMIVGDSITQGSSGDWTWRYRLWRHLRACGVPATFVGPKEDVDESRRREAGRAGAGYADPEFDRAHDAQWGQPYAVAKTTVREHVAAFRPDLLLVLLGINDLVWQEATPAEFEANLREFIANARAGDDGVRLILGTILDTARAHDDFAFGKRVKECNARIRTVAAELRTSRSPIEVADTAAEFVAGEHTWDDTHPNPNGEVRIAAAFADVLARRFDVGSPYPRPYPVLADVPSTRPVHREDSERVNPTAVLPESSADLRPFS